MRRTTALVAAGVLGLALAGPAGGSPTEASAGATCRGEVATIVGSGGDDIVGTEGRDVIVTNRSQSVDALGGDDLICVTGPDESDPWTSHPVEVLAGPGDDVVDGTAARSWPVQGELGPGSDVFDGGAGRDSVDGGGYAPPGAERPDTEVDVLRPGGGDDSVTSGTSSLANADVVDLGGGDDHLRWFGTWSAAASLAGGPGTDRLNVDVTSGETLVDVPRGAITDDGVTAVTFVEVEAFTLWAADRSGVSLAVVGGPASDAVDVWTRQPPASLTADLGGGDDVLSTIIAPLASGGLSGGGGRDRLEMGSARDELSLDLAAGNLRIGDATHVAREWEDALLMAPQVAMSGTSGANELRAVACRADLRGLGGDDYLGHTTDTGWEAYVFGCRKKLVALGGPGDDTFDGSPGPDRLLGGSGSDLFRAGSGNDRISGGAGRDVADGAGSYDVDFDLYGGGPGEDRITGGPGADVLDGDSGDDVILGGPGRDRVDGDRGRDRCVAERERRCER